MADEQKDVPMKTSNMDSSAVNAAADSVTELPAVNLDSAKTVEELLRAKDIALKEILNQLEIEKKALREQIHKNIEKLLLPIIKKLKKKASTIEEGYLELLESSLKELTGTFGGMAAGFKELTPKEIEIANMIRNGLTTKEISKLLKVSALTVSTHRTNIRKKLKITGQNVNLTSFLQ